MLKTKYLVIAFYVLSALIFLCALTFPATLAEPASDIEQDLTEKTPNSSSGGETSQDLSSDSASQSKNDSDEALTKLSDQISKSKDIPSESENESDTPDVDEAVRVEPGEENSRTDESGLETDLNSSEKSDSDMVSFKDDDQEVAETDEEEIISPSCANVSNPGDSNSKLTGESNTKEFTSTSSQEPIKLSSDSQAQVNDYIEVSNQQDLEQISSNLAGHFKLMNDLQLTGSWTPIGSTDNGGFSGIFNGQDFTISNLTINSSSLAGERDAGLFGYTNKAIIKNLQLDNVSIDLPDADNVGSLIGYAENTRIENCTITANEGNNNTVTGKMHTGGMVGQSKNSEFINNAAVVSVTGKDNYTGGLVGKAERSDIINCSAEGSVTGEKRYVGGLVGAVSASYGNSFVSTSTASCIVNGDRYVGGLIGSTFGSVQINKSYASGTVKGNSEAGGFSGILSFRASVINCYTSAAVLTEGNNTGSFTGHAADSVINASSGNYWLLCDNGRVQTSVMGLPMTAEEMMQQENFDGWCFEDTWFVEQNKAYPVLRWQLPADSEPVDEEPVDGNDPDNDSDLIDAPGSDPVSSPGRMTNPSFNFSINPFYSNNSYKLLFNTSDICPHYLEDLAGYYEQLIFYVTQAETTMSAVLLNENELTPEKRDLITRYLIKTELCLLKVIDYIGENEKESLIERISFLWVQIEMLTLKP